VREYWQEECPQCGANLASRLYDRMTDGGTEFDLECSCGLVLVVHVVSVPEFCLSKKTEVEERDRELYRNRTNLRNTAD